VCVCVGEDVLDICRTIRRITSAGGELTSPNYPNSYPSNVDCMCTMSADDPAARLVLSLYDLVLQTKHDRCRADWLMLRQGPIYLLTYLHCNASPSNGHTYDSTTKTVLRFYVVELQRTGKHIQFVLANPVP